MHSFLVIAAMLKKSNTCNLSAVTARKTFVKISFYNIVNSIYLNSGRYRVYVKE